MQYFIIKGTDTELNKIYVTLVYDDKRLEHYIDYPDVKDIDKTTLIKVCDTALVDFVAGIDNTKPVPQTDTTIKDILGVESYVYGSDNSTKIE